MTKDDRKQEQEDDDGGRLAGLEAMRAGDPPESLEERTVEALRREGLIRDRGWSRPLVAAGAIAACMSLLMIGVVAGRLTAPAAPEPDGDTFALLLRSGDSPRPADETADKDLVREYSVWARSVAESGRLLDGQKLDDESRLLIKGERGVATEAAFVTREPRSVQGYFLIRADGYEEAVRLASGCPHLEYGGSIEIRRIDPTP